MQQPRRGEERDRSPASTSPSPPQQPATAPLTRFDQILTGSEEAQGTNRTYDNRGGVTTVVGDHPTSTSTSIGAATQEHSLCTPAATTVIAPPKHPRPSTGARSSSSSSRGLPPGAGYAQSSPWGTSASISNPPIPNTTPTTTTTTTSTNKIEPTANSASLVPAAMRSASLPLGTVSLSSRPATPLASSSSPGAVPRPATPSTAAVASTTEQLRNAQPAYSRSTSSATPTPPGVSQHTPFMASRNAAAPTPPRTWSSEGDDPSTTSVKRTNSALPALGAGYSSPLHTDLPLPISADPFPDADDSEQVLEIRSKPLVSTGATGILTDEPMSMVGVGRNSILRNSPLSPQQQLLGPAPTSPTSPTIGMPLPFNDPPPRPVALPPPHLVSQPEVCVECMMRDRDMADVDVTGEHVWDRESDLEFEEALRWDDENPTAGAGSDQQHHHHHHHRGAATTTAGSEESGSLGTHGGGLRRAGGSRESASGRSSAYGHAQGRKRIGRGQPLTTAGLKLWTSMNPPASAHRWRTLQTYLAMQMHLIEVERQKREAQVVSSEHHEQLQHHLHASGASQATRPASIISNGPGLLPNAPAASTSSRHPHRSSSPWRGGVNAGYLPTEAPDERHARARSQSRASAYLESSNAPALGGAEYRNSTLSLQPPPVHSSAASVRSYSYGDQPWLSNPTRRFSSPGLKELGATNSIGGDGPSAQPARTSSTTPSPSTGFGTFVNKFARSSTDLRSVSSRPNSTRARDNSPPPPPAGHPSSPGRAPSFGLYPTDDRSSLHTNRRGSTWSKFRQSASQSVLSFAPSFAPSGSMMEMHLGMSADRHQAHQGLYAQQGSHPYSMYDQGYPSMSDSMIARGREGPAVAAPKTLRIDMNLDQSMSRGSDGGGGDGGKRSEKEKKKTGFKGFFSKLVGGGGDKKGAGSTHSSSAPATPRGVLHPHNYGNDSASRSMGMTNGYNYYGNNGVEAEYLPDELAPPPPLSTLAKEPRYTRSGSSSSIDSLGAPYTPPLPLLGSNGLIGMGWRNSGGGGGPHAADRRSINTLGSYTSTRSKILSGGGGGGRSWLNSGVLVGAPSAPIRRPSSDSLNVGPPPHADTAEVLSSYAPIAPRSPRTQKSLPMLAHAPQSGWEPARSSSSLYGEIYGPPPPLPRTEMTSSYGGGIGRSEAFSQSSRSLFSSSRSNRASPTDEATSSRKSKPKSKVFSLPFGGGGVGGARKSAREVESNEVDAVY